MINKNNKIYMMGSLFNEADVNQRKLEERKLRSLGYDNIYNPINAPCNDKSKLPTAQDIFLQDTEQVLSSDIIVGDISRSDDPGVFTELGIVYMCNYIDQLKNEGFTSDEIISKIKPKKVITHLSHISKSTAHNYEGNHIPIGFNQYMIGCIEEMDGKIKDNFEEVTKEMTSKTYTLEDLVDTRIGIKCNTEEQVVELINQKIPSCSYPVNLTFWVVENSGEIVCLTSESDECDEILNFEEINCIFY